MLRAIQDSFVKLDPRKLSRNPVILATEIVAVLATISTVDAFRTGAYPWWAFQIALWLWFTVVFANFAESIAEGRGKAAADALRAQRVDVKAKLIIDDNGHDRADAGLQARRRQRRAGRGRRHGPLATATSSRASPRSTRRRSPASPRR